mgnify:CR=1 FL=1
MAVTASGLYVLTFIDILDTTQLAIDLDLETHKGAMFTNTITPNFSTDTAYGVAPYNANEVSGTGYTAGGNAITTTTVTESPAGTLMWDAADMSWTTSTITNARCLLAYADVLAGAVQRATLTDENVAREHVLAAELLQAQPLAL